MSALLEAREVSRHYRMGENVVVALDRASVAVAEGEFVALQGTSGSGKSTLLNLLGGLDHPTEGEIVFDGRALSPLSKREMARYRLRSVGMIFQNFNLIPTMTAAENVELALAFGGMTGRARERRARELLEGVGLGERGQHRPAELSGGEQQRVAIARALANRPRLLLADEPTGQLDSQTGQSIMGVIRTIVQHEGITAIVATHDPMMLDVADRILELHDGRLAEHSRGA